MFLVAAKLGSFFFFVCLFCFLNSGFRPSINVARLVVLSANRVFVFRMQTVLRSHFHFAFYLEVVVLTARYLILKEIA